mmetsp:Transcript_2197/g.6510  ORF Transcript_2197/g.6510 Transcript_2197/m.6510 type:complete len:91 (+) Transcript_2197:1102-1374(+)
MCLLGMLSGGRTMQRQVAQRRSGCLEGAQAASLATPISTSALAAPAAADGDSGSLVTAASSDRARLADGGSPPDTAVHIGSPSAAVPTGG